VVEMQQQVSIGWGKVLHLACLRRAAVLGLSNAFSLTVPAHTMLVSNHVATVSVRATHSFIHLFNFHLSSTPSPR
jgi:hypothetical protein